MAANSKKHPRIRFCRIRGARKRETHTPCEDRILLQQEPDLLFLGLADGQSRKPRCGQGAWEALNVLARMIRKLGIGWLLDHPFPDELPALLMQEIRKRLLDSACTDGADFHDYASTLLALAADPATGRYLLIHLGDGCAIGVTGENRLRMLSAPENGIDRHSTWLTTSRNAVSHLRIARGDISALKRIFLLSDGAVRLCRGQRISFMGHHLMQCGSWRDVRKHLCSFPPEDDASCIFWEIPTKKPLKIQGRSL